VAEETLTKTLQSARAKGLAASSSLGNDAKKGSPFGLGCAYGLPANLLLVQNLKPTSDALNSKKLCMGELGGLLPRQGLINHDDPFRSAVMAAWKFASLTKDAFFDSVGGIEPSDKWQLIFPTSDQQGCFDPDNAAKDWPILGPGESRKEWEVGKTYVFAIWRQEKTTSCYEYGTAKWRWLDVVKKANYPAILEACKL
jgi:hypothetical protein